MKLRFLPLFAILFTFTATCISCKGPTNPNIEMAELVRKIFKENEHPNNIYNSAGAHKYYDSIFQSPEAMNDPAKVYGRATLYLQRGEEKKAIELFERAYDLTEESNDAKRTLILKNLAIAWTRHGERVNCINSHTGESCIFPIRGEGIHTDLSGSENAIKIYETLLKKNPSDYESRWLLNIAYMTIDGYPDEVPKEYLLTFLDDTSYAIKPFVNAAIKNGLNLSSVAGTSITEDFNNDGYLDIITSSMDINDGIHYFLNNGDGTFSDATHVSRLSEMAGGLNIQPTDYNNDGFVDIYVMRGAWKSQFGREPNSLIRNNGDGTFTDVTKESGLMDFAPCISSVWADFNNDGFLDLFVANETVNLVGCPSLLFINNKNGTFTECSKICGIDVALYAKGVNAGDYNNDGLVDLYISAMTGEKFLFKNNGINSKGLPSFTDVSKQAGITNTFGAFATWFWDFDNDGYLDIANCLYRNSDPVTYLATAEALGKLANSAGQLLLYRNKGDGTFEDVSGKTKLANRVFYTMGCNFGDIDNDGYLDFYVACGTPDLAAAIPNRMFRNINGEFFEDVTGSARVGSIQKSHGTSFADVDNDGDLDLFIEQGGLYEGDAYQNAFYINPGQNDNNWISVRLKGVKANAPGIGARIKVTFTENGVQRTVHRSLTTGSSYGANPFIEHVGIGTATNIDLLEIKWPGSGTIQTFTNLQPNKRLIITEGKNEFAELDLKKLDFMDPNRTTIGCAPLKQPI